MDTLSIELPEIILEDEIEIDRTGVAWYCNLTYYIVGGQSQLMVVKILVLKLYLNI